MMKSEIEIFSDKYNGVPLKSLIYNWNNEYTVDFLNGAIQFIDNHDLLMEMRFLFMINMIKIKGAHDE